MADAGDAVIISAGHNGLRCACYLVRAGLRVLKCVAYEIRGDASNKMAVCVWDSVKEQYADRVIAPAVATIRMIRNFRLSSFYSSWHCARSDFA